MSDAILPKKPLPARLCERFRAIRWLVDFQKTRLYPILFALMCVISSVNGMAVYIPIFWLMTALVLFSIIFTDDTKVLLVPMFLGYYAVGRDLPINYYDWPDHFGALFSPFYEKGLFHMILCGLIMVTALLLRIVLDGTLKKSFRKRGLFFFGILILSGVILFNGIFTPHWQPMDLFYGMFMSIGLLVFYCLLSSFWEHSKDTITYACHTLVCNSGSVLLQILIWAIRTHRDGRLLVYDKAGSFTGIWRDAFCFSWGVTTVVGAMLVLGIPAALYLAKKSHRPLPYSLLATLFFLGSVFINTRSAMLVGGLVLLLGIILNSVKSKNPTSNRIFALCLALAFLAALLVLLFHFGGIQKIWELLRLHDKEGSGRIDIWQLGIADFLLSPIIGVGFMASSYTTYKNVFGNMYHSLPIEFLGATGVIGAIAFLFHFKDVVRLTVRRFSVDKLMLLLVPLMVLAMSLVDNFFFYLHFQIPYAIFLLLAERAEQEAEMA